MLFCSIKSLICTYFAHAVFAEYLSFCINIFNTWQSHDHLKMIWAFFLLNVLHRIIPGIFIHSVVMTQ